MHGGGRLLRHLQVPDFVHEGIDSTCPDCWKEGCGLNKCFGLCADGLEVINPFMEQFAAAIWCLGSPLAFPLIFCFPAEPHTHESSGYEISMLGAPCRRPCACCLTGVCLPCGQWYARRKVLGGDMTKYKLWQGFHDGPHCCARRCPGAPIVIESGTYGEQDCPNAFLCLEVCCLGGFYSVCCAFDVTRRYQREERGLSLDPTEARQQHCISFFSQIMHQCFKLGCCLCLSSCCIGLCAPDSAGAQDCAGQGGRAARSCCRIAHTIWKGIIWTRVIAMGCMTAQIIHEAETEWDGKKKARPDKLIKPPKAEKMKDRGFDDETRKTADEEEPVEFADMKMPWEEEAERKTKKNAPRSVQMDRGFEEEKQEEQDVVVQSGNKGRDEFEMVSSKK